MESARREQSGSDTVKCDDFQTVEPRIHTLYPPTLKRDCHTFEEVYTVSVGHRITARLRERGLRKLELAAHFDRSPAWVSHLLGGRKHLTPELAEELCGFLDVPGSFFCGDIVVKTTEPVRANSPSA